MEELIAAVAAKTGLPADKAKDAADAVLGFLKEKLPAPIAGQIDGLVSGNSNQIGDALGGVTDKLKGMFGGQLNQLP